MKHGETRNNRMICHTKPREISLWFARNSDELQDVMPAWSGFLEQTYKEIYCNNCGWWVKCMGMAGVLKWIAIHGDGTCCNEPTTEQNVETS